MFYKTMRQKYEYYRCKSQKDDKRKQDESGCFNYNWWWICYSRHQSSRRWKGLFIAMPSRKAADGEYRDIAHPINSQTRNSIQEIVLAAYEKALLEPDPE